MDIDEAGFWPQLLPILRSICDATFVAIDVEMSGIPMKGYGSNDRSRLVGKPSLQQLYEETKEAALKYQILQIGITCVEEDPERDMYIARPYNFNVSPLLIHGERLDIKRDFTFQSGAIQFLIKHSFDMGAVFTRGVPYLSREEESTARINYNKKKEMTNSIPDIVISPDDEEIVDFYTKARKTIFDFTNQHKQELDFVNIGHPNGLSGLQRRLVHQLVRNEFPSCRTFSRGGGEFMQVEKADAEKEVMIAKQRLVTFESSLARQTGLRYIFEALAGGDLKGIDPKWFRIDEKNQPVFTDMEVLKKTIHSLQTMIKKKAHVIVGHNVFTDLIFLYQTFVGTLPDQITEFSEQIHKVFPQVFDTKYLATQAGNSLRNKSGLKDLYDELKNRKNPFIALAERHVSYGVSSKEHEAGYDSWMTAQVFVKLSSKLAAEQGLVGHFDGTPDSAPATPEKEIETDLSSGFQPAPSTERRLRQESKHKSNKRSFGSSTGSTIKEGPKFKGRTNASFSDTNMFSNLHVEGQDDGESTRSSSPDHEENGGVSLLGNRPAPELSLMDSDIDGDFQASFDESGLLNAQSAEFIPSSDELPPKNVPGGLSRYYYAAKLNEPATSDHPGDGPKVNPWMPRMNSSFWNIYANRLRVYGTESEVCCLNA